jgi:predicted dehydrogenase
MTNDSKVSRRSFLEASVTGGAGVAALSGISFFTQARKVRGANDRVRIGVVGIRGQGFTHIEGYSAVPNTEVAAICDVDETVIGQRLADMDKRNLPKPKVYVDYRKLLEDKSLDAVSIATPNHWHSLMGIWGCQAGKDVYVEKPCSHTWWEGHQLVRAARQYDRIVMHGTQGRSAEGYLEGVRKLREGVIGEVYLARGLCFKWRNSIGKAPVEPVPAGVHYDLWTGPAPMKPFTRNRFHYNWHWIWDTGNGDLGNQGVHEVDLARWGLGVKLPNKVSALGGHFMFDDDQETPNTLNCAFEFRLPDGKKRLLEFEVRHWISNTEAEIGMPGFGAGAAALPQAAGAAALPQGAGAAYPSFNQIKAMCGNLFYGSKGYMAMTGYESFRTWLGEEQEPGPSATRGGDRWANFIQCVRTRRKEELLAPIEEGHLSATLVHLANVSYRLGRTLNFDPETEQVIADEEANRLLRGDDRGYREPFIVPEKV